jgi:Flp pilus assembly pilin Flp
MLADRRGADLVEWIVGVVIVLGVVGVSVYTLFQTIGAKFTEINSAMYP